MGGQPWFVPRFHGIPRIYSDSLGFLCVVSLRLVRRTPGAHARSVATSEAKMLGDLGGFWWRSLGKASIDGEKRLVTGHRKVITVSLKRHWNILQ